MSIKITIEVDGTKNDVEQLRAVLRGLLNDDSISTQGAGEDNDDAADALDSVPGQGGKRKRRKRKESGKRAKRGEGVIAQVRGLIDDNYLADWRSAAEVKAVLEADGQNIGKTQIYSALKYHYDRNRLIRQETDGVYMYRVA
jgi:hypothetical protein